MDKKLGSYAFLVVIVLAIIAALVPALQANATVTWILVLLGLIVGLMNVTKKETMGFLIAGIGLNIVSATLPNLGLYLTAILNNINVFVAPAVLVVALKAIYDYAEKK